MGSIRGPEGLLEHLRAETECERFNLDEYLKSAAWKAVAQAVLSKWPDCAVCEEPATGAAPLDFHDDTLTGKREGAIMPVCDCCRGMVDTTSPSWRATRAGFIQQLTPKHFARHKAAGKPKRS